MSKNPKKIYKHIHTYALSLFLSLLNVNFSHEHTIRKTLMRRLKMFLWLVAHVHTSIMHTQLNIRNTAWWLPAHCNILFTLASHILWWKITIEKHKGQVIRKPYEEKSTTYKTTGQLIYRNDFWMDINMSIRNFNRKIERKLRFYLDLLKLSVF